ncbi:MAG TPA: DNA primase [Planctomycetota bacterium]|nr:DNA primase [Planctomycetota bacterium]
MGAYNIRSKFGPPAGPAGARGAEGRRLKKGGFLARISEESILEVKNAVDIVEVVSGYLPLKRKSGSYWAPCPFHEEKTASFHVVPDRQFYKCFGCGASGGVIDFIVRHDKLDFPAAVELLAEKSSVTLRYEGGSGPPGAPRDGILRTLEWAAGFYRKQLKTAAEASPAREFLRKRGVSEETEDAWGLGWAPEGWDGLLRKARREGVDEKLLVAAGLTVEKDGGGRYDRFRARVMFPIFDVRGKTVAFGARTLKDENPKFLNSPETALFSKGRQLFGLHAARDAAEESRTLYIVEGYLDVIVPWQAGVRGIVATLGTALTRDHLKVLKRHADRVVLVFDSDAAGKKAAERGLDLLLGEDMDLFVAELPPGEDTDDVIQKSGPEALRAVLGRPKEVFAFLVESLSARIDTSTPSGKTRIVQELLDRIATVPNPVKQAFLVKEVSKKFGVAEGLLMSRLRREEAPAPPKSREKAPEVSGLGRDLLALLAGGTAISVRVRREVPLERWPDAASAAVARKAYELMDRTGAVTASDLLAVVRDEAALSVLAEALEHPVRAEKAGKHYEDCLDLLKTRQFETEKAGVLHDNALVEARQGIKRLKHFPRQNQGSIKTKQT